MKYKSLIILSNFILALVIGLVGHTASAQSDIPAIAAASDLKFALEDIATRFRNDTQRDVRLSFGSSGNYFRQIAERAPFQMFLSADEGFVFRLHEAGKTEDRGVLYAVGRLVLFAPTGSPLKVDTKAAGLKAALTANQISRFAIANPEHAPYGRAAEEALRTLGMWDALQGKMVLGENVSQAAQFATSGSSQGGIFAYSLALTPSVSKLGQYVLLPEEMHKPLRQQMVLVKGAGETARAFYAYLQQPAGRKILTQYGFVLPAETKK